MAMRQKGQKTYTTMQGKQVDMDLLRKKNELTPAVGNARVNARGDELGPGGKIVRKREQVIKDYYKGSMPVAEEPALSVSDVVSEEAPAAQKAVKSKTTTRAQQKVEEAATLPTEAELKEFDDDWVEDTDGNFVQKGD
ncbi:MAG: hypothetical protein ACKVJK_00740 [Methylophagaceae bacterium]|jgi:hypothetical protein|tara:strand:- start:1859 stop:2272 length:414 start_codon:yes stop_codon:yes gene_type:complete